tara:strand:- start:334 stop:660 length:327 start_codon:yes stop_codon:yes gene_type:complete
MAYNKEELDVWVTQQSLPIVSPKYTSINRQSRRAIDKELQKIGRELIDVESRFLDQLFEEDRGISYDDLYRYYLRQYLDNIAACKSLFKPKHVNINEYYFEKTYRSVV